MLGREVADTHPERHGRARHGIDGLAQAPFAGCGEDEGGCDPGVEDSSAGGVPVEVEEGRVGERAGDGIGGVRGVGKHADDREGVCGKSEAFQPRARRLLGVCVADGGASDVVVAVVVVGGDAPGEGLVAVGRVVVGAVRVLEGEEAAECIGDGLCKERPEGRGCAFDGLGVEAVDAGRCPIGIGQFAELFVGESVLVGVARAVGEKASACAGERFGGACVPHERGRGRLRHCHTFRCINFRVTVQVFGSFEPRHADVDRLFRGECAVLGRPWRCEDLQRKPCYSGRVLAGRAGAFSAPGDPGWRFCWSQWVRHAGQSEST